MKLLNDGHNFGLIADSFGFLFDFNTSDGRVVRASASGAVDLGLIPNRVKPLTLKLVFTAFLHDAQH